MFHEAAGRHIAFLRISAGIGEKSSTDTAITNAIANSHAVHAMPERRHHGRPPHCRGRSGNRHRVVLVEAATSYIDVGEVQRDGGVANADLAGTRRRQLDLLKAHDVGAAMRMDANGSDHCVTLRDWVRSANL